MFKYETHCHTSSVSKCGSVSPREIVEFYKNKGYAGIFVTEHFMNGNSVIDKSLPWSEQIEIYCRGYEEAEKWGEKIGLDVFFGVEYTYLGSDFLTYGIDKEWLIAHPEIMDMHITEYCQLVREEGGFIIHAHPFREASYIRTIRLIPRYVDGVETVNSCTHVNNNLMAEQYADYYGLLKTAGSDTHHFDRTQLSGLMTKRRIQSPMDMLRELKDNTAKIFIDNI